MLEAAGLSKRYGDEVAFEDASIRLEPGDFAVLVGRSGAGKTTLLRCINGLEQPDSGTVRLDDEPLAPIDAALVFQAGALVDGKSALENVLDGGLAREPIWRELLGWHDPEEKRQGIERLHEVGLSGYATRRVGALSGGQRQRVGIARALHQNPEVLLADEPVASLDPRSTAAVMGALKRINAEDGLPVLCNLHHIDLARDYCTRIIGVRRGQLVFDGPVEALDDAAIRSIYDQ